MRQIFKLDVVLGKCHPNLRTALVHYTFIVHMDCHVIKLFEIRVLSRAFICEQSEIHVCIDFVYRFASSVHHHSLSKPDQLMF